MSEFHANWLRDAAAFTHALRNRGGEFDTLEVEILPPIPRSKVSTLEDSLGVSIPADLNEIFTTATSRATFRYVWEPAPELKKPLKSLFDQDYLYGGGTLFDADSVSKMFNDCREFAEECWLADDDFKDQQEFWLNALPFLETGGGDYLALDLRGGSNVIYLSHDDDNSGPIAPSLDAFLKTWQKIGYVGPESWVLQHFIDPKSGFLSDPDAAQLEQLQKLFGV